MKILLQSLLTSFTLALVAVPAGAQFTNFVTIAGTPGNPGYANGTNGGALFQWPYGIAQDTRSNLYVVDGYENVIRKLTPAGTNWVVTTIAGTPNPSAGDADGTNGSASFYNPVGIAVDTNGNLYVGENYGSTIRKITPVGTNWVVTTIAGQTGNFGWADGTNQAALFNGPENLTVDAQGNLFVADFYNSVIRKITPVGTNWVVTTIAGSPTKYGYADGTNRNAAFDYPYGLAFDRAGNLYVSDDVFDFGGSTIRKLTPMGTNWVVTTIAGTPTASGSADGTNSTALFNQPYSIAADSAGNLFVADYGNGSIRRVTPIGTNWVVSTISGPGAFSKPWGAALDTVGHLFVTDNGNSTVLMGLVELPPPPMAAFSGTPTNGVAPLVVTFTNLSSNASNYVWNFGDGNTLTAGSNTNVTETYTNAGAYTVTLTAYGPGGVNVLTNTAYIQVTTPGTNVPNPTVQFIGPATVLVSWPNTGSYVLQTNANLTTPWVDYGGPVTTTNGISSAIITLPATGTLFFRLRVGTVVQPPPVAAFSGTPTNGVAPLAVTFTNLSSNATNYVWSFGDGHTLSTGSSTNVTDTYTNAGAYTVILTAYGPGGVAALTNTAYIQVTMPATNVPNPTIQYIGPSTVLVSWPNTGNYVLQTNANLATPNWVNYGGPVTTSNGICSVTIVLPPGLLFFRLAVQTIQNVPPNPTIGFAGLNTLVISWPSTGNFTLQTNANLATTNWGNYGGPVTTANGINSVTNSAIAPGQNRLFFRLKH